MQRIIMAGWVRNSCVPVLLLAFVCLPPVSLRSQTFKLLHNFSRLNDGADPESGVVLIGSTLYGTTIYGGISNYNAGSVYSVNTDATGYQVLFSFPAGEGNPTGDFVISDNVLYTTAVTPNWSDGPNGFGGSIIEVPIDGSNQFPINWYNFAIFFGDGIGPDGLISSGGVLYGVTHSGGQFGQGTVYAYDGSIVTNLYSFAGNDGANPNGSLVLHNGVFYGVTSSGGNGSNGTVYSINADGTGFKTLHQFSGTANGEGANPLAGLILWSNTLFGTTSSGGVSTNGTIFSISTNGTGFKTLYSFSGGRDGAKPAAALDLAGTTLFGTTAYSGAGHCGTVFAFGIDGSGFTTLHSFNGADGAYPRAQLLLYSNTLYGTTSGDVGITGYGSVFSLWLGSSPPQPPQLTITPSTQTVVLMWPTNGTFFLESTTNLASPPPAWTKVSTTPVVINGLNTVTNFISQAQQFYRLSQ